MSGIHEKIRRRIEAGGTNTDIARELGVAWWKVAYQREQIAVPISTNLEPGDRVLYRGDHFCRVLEVGKCGATIDLDGKPVYANFGQIPYAPDAEEISARAAVLRNRAMAAIRGSCAAG
jgi:hypothetical protein